jgi:molecular chaperone GrpE
MDDERSKDRKGNGRDIPFTVIDRRPVLGDGETSSLAPPGPRHPAYVEQLQARADEAERQAREISSAYRKIEEEREAFRERLTRDLGRRVDIARADLMRKVLDILDDLDRAIAAARTATDPGRILEGITLTREHLLQVLASEGVDRLETFGRPFDPAFAEAVASEEVEDPSRDNIVLEEMAKGYTLRGTLLRPARVRVGRCPACRTAQPEEPAT